MEIEEAKRLVLEAHPDAECLKLEDMPIYHVYCGDGLTKHLSTGFSESQVWIGAARNIQREKP